jgi:hypothetical protein
VTLWSDTPGARLLANQALRYKQRMRMAEHLLLLWQDRWLPDEDGSKGTFDDSEPGFSDLLDATDKLLHGTDNELEEVFREMPHFSENLPSM